LFIPPTQHVIAPAKSLEGRSCAVALCGNVLLQTHTHTACLSLLEAPTEEVAVFKAMSCGDTATCCLLTPTAAIIGGSDSFAEFTFGK
jgi:hypothetical protein